MTFLRISLLSIIFIYSGAFADTNFNSLRELNQDAESKAYREDFYSAYRTYLNIESQNANYFGQHGITGYLQSLFIVGTDNQIKSECTRLSHGPNITFASKASYICGLHFIEVGKGALAEEFSKQISDKSHFYIPGQILRASAAMLVNRPQNAVVILQAANQKKYEQYGLMDEVNVTLARALVAENKLEDALKNYQLVSADSLFYVDSLEETAWVFYKMHRTESAQVLLDVIVAHYESGQRLGNGIEISTASYYRSRYLKAYLELVEAQTDGATTEFTQFKNDYLKTSNDFKGKIKPQDLDGNNLLEKLKGQLELVGSWLGAEERLKLENSISFQAALTLEEARVKKFSSVITKADPHYASLIEDLKKITADNFSQQYALTLTRLSRELNTFKIKADLGQMEIAWIKRTDGARTLDEVIDSYVQEAKALDDFVE